MAMNFDALFKVRKAWGEFAKNHPKVPVFINNLQNKKACEGMEIAVAIRYPDGDEFKTGIRVKESDLELLEILKTIK